LKHGARVENTHARFSDIIPQIVPFEVVGDSNMLAQLIDNLQHVITQIVDWENPYPNHMSVKNMVVPTHFHLI
jgi:hypothetical protein